MRGCLESASLRVVASREHIAAPAHTKGIAAFRRAFLDEVDAARDETQHRIVGTRPPVAVRLRSLVARERHRVAFIDEHHASHALANGQMIRGRDTGDSRSANYDVSVRTHRWLCL